jgi:hypothetical protein
MPDRWEANGALVALLWIAANERAQSWRPLVCGVKKAGMA